MPQPLYKFDRWTLDCERGVLTSQAGDVTLRPKSFEVLRFLIENAGRLVSRDEMLAAVWPGLTVTEESLTQCVSEVRSAMSDGEQRIIKTVPKRGYLFGIPVKSGGQGDRDLSAQPATARQLLEGPSIAVLPFANLSGDKSQEYLSDEITEDIINGLTYFSDLSVIARNSSFSYKDRAIDVREIGRQLGVRYIVEGSVRRFGERIRITAQLVDALSGVQRWAERFDRPLGDIFALQDDITAAIVRIVVAHLGTAEQERAAHKPPSSWTAYDLLMQGDHAWRALEQSWVTQHLYKAHQLFEQAYKADPDNAAICARLALTFVRAHADPANPGCGDPNSLKRGYEMAMRAVSLDPNLPFARTRLGWALFWMNRLDELGPRAGEVGRAQSKFFGHTFPGDPQFRGRAGAGARSQPSPGAPRSVPSIAGARDSRALAVFARTSR